jgi:hypothetical protein
MAGAACWAPPPSQNSGRRHQTFGRLQEQGLVRHGADRRQHGQGTWFGLRRQQVGGDFNRDRLRPAGERVAGQRQDRAGNGIALLHPLGPAGHRAQHGELVVGLMDEALALAQPAPVDLGGDQQDRRGGEARLVQAAHRVGGAGAGAGDGDAEAAGGAGIAVGGMDGTLLVPGPHDLDTTAAGKGVVQSQILLAGDAEHMADVQRLERLIDRIAARIAAHGAGGAHRAGRFLRSLCLVFTGKAATP